MVRKYWLIYRPDSGVSYWSPINWKLKNITIIGMAILDGPFAGIYLRNKHSPTIFSKFNRNEAVIWVGKDMCIKKQYYNRRNLLIPFNPNVYIQKIQLEHEQFKIEQTSDGWDVVFKGRSTLVRRPVKN